MYQKRPSRYITVVSFHYVHTSSSCVQLSSRKSWKLVEETEISNYSIDFPVCLDVSLRSLIFPDNTYETGITKCDTMLGSLSWLHRITSIASSWIAYTLVTFVQSNWSNYIWDCSIVLTLYRTKRRWWFNLNEVVSWPITRWLTEKRMIKLQRHPGLHIYIHGMNDTICVKLVSILKILKAEQASGQQKNFLYELQSGSVESLFSMKASRLVKNWHHLKWVSSSLMSWVLFSKESEV